MRYAEVLNNTVINIVESSPEFIWPFETELVELNQDEFCEPGFIYMPEETPRFIKQTTTKVFTSYQFMLRLTPEERASIRASALTDVIVADFLQLAQAAQEIETSNPITIQGMDYLVMLGLLSEQRKNEILGV
jgi:hypothetical protein